VEAHLTPFRDSTKLDARYVHGLRRTYHNLETILEHPIEVLDDVAHVESHFGPFRDGVSAGAR
jgi:hypothetical protein